MTSNALGLEGFAFRTSVRVSFRDLDALGHVNNAVYLTYMESARLAYWMEVTSKTSLREMDIILARAEVDFRSPASYGENLVVGVRVATLGRSSFTMEFRIVETPSGRLVAEARKVLVYYDYTAGRSAALPADVRNRLEIYEGRTLQAT